MESCAGYLNRRLSMYVWMYTCIFNTNAVCLDLLDLVASFSASSF